MLSIFSRSQPFNNFFDILSRFLLPSLSLKTDMPVAYKRYLSFLFFGFVEADFFCVSTKLLAKEGFLSWNLTNVSLMYFHF